MTCTSWPGCRPCRCRHTPARTCSDCPTRAGTRAQFLREWLRAQPDPLLGHQFRRRVVHQMRVFDARDASGDRSLDRLWRVGMHGDVRAPVRRSLDGSAQLFVGERHGVERAVWRRHAAAGAELDLRGAEHQLLAHPQADFIGAVGDRESADQFPTGQRRAWRARHFERQPEVAVSGRDRDHRAGWPDARTDDHAFIDGALEAPRRSAHVAHGGEPAHQRVGGLGARHEVGVALGVGQRGRGRRPHEDGVPVHVDQARHERAPAPVDDDGGGAAIGRDGRGRDAFDAVATHEHERRRREGAALAVEDADVLEQRDGRRGRCGDRLRDGRQRERRSKREVNEQTYCVHGAHFPCSNRRRRSRADATRDSPHGRGHA